LFARTCGEKKNKFTYEDKFNFVSRYSCSSFKYNIKVQLRYQLD